MHYQTIPTQTGVRMVQHGTVLSEIRTSPGPTHSVADVIAAAVRAIGAGPRIAMLGFAGGGMLAPLRAMGSDETVSAVDLDESGWLLFRRLCSAWAGEVTFERAEACAWLRQNRRRYDVIIEDLSIPRDSDVFKPAVTWAGLPSLIYPRMKPDGAVIFNLLHPGDCSWENGFHRIVRKGFDARVVSFTDYENRLLIVSRRLPAARGLSVQMRVHLKQIRSRLARRIVVGRHFD